MKKIFPILFLLLAVVAFLYIYHNKIFSPKYLGDLHMHTSCSDGKNTYEEMIQTAIKLKLNFIAITDHKICNETFARCRNETRIICFPGQEITGRIHLLAVNITKYIDPKLSLHEQVAEIHAQGGIAIAAHPNSKDFYYIDSELKDSGIDAQECTSDSSERRFLPCVWDSDAHNTKDLAWQFNSCNVQIKSINNLKSAILNHNCGRTIAQSLFEHF